MAAISITLNGTRREVPAEVDLDNLLELFSMPKKRVAVELNKTVVARGDWPTTIVRDEDAIEVVHFVGGG